MRKARIRTLARRLVKRPAAKLFIRCSDDGPEVLRDLDSVGTPLRTQDVIDRHGELRPAIMHPHQVSGFHFSVFIGLFALRDDDPRRIASDGPDIQRDKPWIFPLPDDADGNSTLDFELYEPASAPQHDRRQLPALHDYGPGRR